MLKSIALLGLVFTTACSNVSAPADQSTIKDSDDTAGDARVTQVAMRRWVCSEYSRSTREMLQRTVVLSQTDPRALEEGEPSAFSLEIFEGTRGTPSLSSEGKVVTEDVHLYYESTSGDQVVTFATYLDELEESSLTIDGEEAGDFVCRDAEVPAQEAEPGVRMICSEYDRDTDKILSGSMMVYQTDNQGMVEGSPLAFSLELYKGPESWTNDEIVGTVETEDVHFFFSSADGSVTMSTYLDELAETTLTVNGVESSYICR